MKQFTITLQCDDGLLLDLALSIATEIAARAAQIEAMPIYGERVLAYSATHSGDGAVAATLKRIS